MDFEKGSTRSAGQRRRRQMNGIKEVAVPTVGQAKGGGLSDESAKP